MNSLPLIVSSSDSTWQYRLSLLQLSPNSVQLVLNKWPKGENASDPSGVVSSVHVLDGVKVEGGVVSGEVEVLFWKVSVRVTFGAGAVRVQYSGEDDSYPLSTADETAALAWLQGLA